MAHRLMRLGERDDLPAWGPVSAMALLAALVLTAVGLPPFDLHGPLHFIGIMDPLCGGTRAARYLMLGDWQEAWRYNPGIFVLATVMGLGLVRWGLGSYTGRWWSPALPCRVGAWSLTVALVALEVHQQLNASLLMAR